MHVRCCTVLYKYIIIIQYVHSPNSSMIIWQTLMLAMIYFDGGLTKTGNTFEAMRKDRVKSTSHCIHVTHLRVFTFCTSKV